MPFDYVWLGFSYNLMWFCNLQTAVHVEFFTLFPAAGLFLTHSHIIVKPSDYMLMWFYLGVEFPQGSSFLHLTANLPTALCSSSSCLSPFTVRLLRYSGPSVPHIIISENTHTAHTVQHRWVAQSLSSRWIGNYLPSWIFFLPFFPLLRPLPSSLHLHAPLICFFLAVKFLSSAWLCVCGNTYRYMLCMDLWGPLKIS